MKIFRKTAIILLALTLVMGVMTVKSFSVYAAEETGSEAETQDNTVGMKAIAAAISIGAVGVAGALAMGMSISKSNESVARQPEAAGKIQTQLMLGLVFIETAIIYALIVAILIVFVM